MIPDSLDKPEPAKEPEGSAWRRQARRLKHWVVAHRMKLVTIEDTPHSIALGSAIGIFFGFTPLLSLKTLLSIAFAWVSRSNKIAAALAVTLHDVMLPLMPAIYLWEYKLGILAMRGHWPNRLRFQHLSLRQYMKWTTFFDVGLPVLIGSLFLALPCAVLVYFFMRGFVARARARQELVGSLPRS